MGKSSGFVKILFGSTREKCLETTVLEETTFGVTRASTMAPSRLPLWLGQSVLPDVKSPLSQTGSVFLFYLFLSEIRCCYSSACKPSNVLPSNTDFFLSSIMPFVAGHLLSFTSLLLIRLALVILDFLVLEHAKLILAAVPMNLLFP